MKFLEISILSIYLINPLWAEQIVIPDFNKVAKEAGLPLSASGSCKEPESIKRDVGDIWRLAGFKNASVQTINGSNLQEINMSKVFTSKISLTAVVFRNTGWSGEMVKLRMKRLSEVYSQCGIKINKLTLVEADAPNGWIDVDYSNERRDLNIAEMTPETEKPVIYYVRSSYEGQTAYAWDQSKHREPSLTDTVWMTSEIIRKSNSAFYPNEYNTESHELGHIFTNEDHVKDGSKNVMAGDFDLLSDKLSTAQCDKMKQHPLVSPL